MDAADRRDLVDDPLLVEGPLEQLLTGWPIDAERLTCQGCATVLRESMACVARVVVPPAEPAVRIAAVHCRDCAPSQPVWSGTAAREWVVEARVATVTDPPARTHWPCLIDVVVRAERPPDTG